MSAEAMYELLIQTRNEVPAAALVQGRRLLEYLPLEEDSMGLSGGIFLGRVQRVMKGLKAVFVALPKGQEGFLPFAELPHPHKPAPGESLLVQIRRPAQGGKSAYLSCKIHLAGRLAVLQPQGEGLSISTRAKEREALRQAYAPLLAPGMGLILRSQASLFKAPAIQEEIKALLAQWEGLQAQAKAATAPQLLLPAPGPIQRLLRDLQGPLNRVLTDDLGPVKGLGLRTHLQEAPFALYSIQKQLHDALKRRVHLPSGGSLVLDPCEACLVIDVNSGADNRQRADLRLATNLEAAPEIARLLRLRRVGGMVLVDFIDMDSEQERAQVIAALEAAFALDRTKSEILGFTRLGLLEITRRRTDSPLPAQRLQGHSEQENNEEEQD